MRIELGWFISIRSGTRTVEYGLYGLVKGVLSYEWAIVSPELGGKIKRPAVIGVYFKDGEEEANPAFERSRLALKFA